MFGNNRLVVTILLIVSSLITVPVAGERKLPEKPFRIGIEGEPGLKSVNGEAFQLDYGIVFKIRERFSIIPRFGLQSYEYEKKTTYYNVTSSTTYHEKSLNICVAFRYEFVKRLTTENTRYEYDADKREFNHYYYGSPLRPYAQFIGGTFTGFGGGIAYYVIPQVSIGAGADVGWNWLATADHKTGFAVIAPKAVVNIFFN